MVIFQIFSWLVFVILLAALFLLFFWMWTIITAKVPFVSVPNGVLEDIEKALDLKDGSVVYDLGSGDGRILFYLSSKNPNSKFLGIENNPFPYILAKVAKFLKGKKNSKVELKKEDFFNSDLSNATHIVTYLYPEVMDELLPKLENELKEGTRLISVSFKFTLKKPSKEIDLNRGKYQLAKKIFVYEF